MKFAGTMRLLVAFGWLLIISPHLAEMALDQSSCSRTALDLYFVKLWTNVQRRQVVHNLGSSDSHGDPLRLRGLSEIDPVARLKQDPHRRPRHGADHRARRL